MTAPTETTDAPSIALTTTAQSASAVARQNLSPERQAIIDERKAQNAMATAIRGATWSKELSADGVRSLAEYCRRHNLDPLRHIDVLGGNIYLNADFYDERAAPLIQRGIIIPHQVEFINADARLEALASAGDEWAKGESMRRLRARIEHNVPDKAIAAAVQRFTLTSTGREIIGVNWCGGGSRQRDPVGDTEPTKTAETRARRRALIKILEVLPEYGTQLDGMHGEMAQLNEVIVADVIGEKSRQAEMTAANRPRALSAGAFDPYAEALDVATPMPSEATQRANIARHLAAEDPYASAPVATVPTDSDEDDPFDDRALEQ
jgi:hypothetical protein